MDLKYSFQDEKYLYLVMEFCAGGDLMNLLIKKDILTEDETRFYIAEIVLAVESIHNMHYTHRDLKPDNILIDCSGHLKLSDFGLCKHYSLNLNSGQQHPMETSTSTYMERRTDYRKNRNQFYSVVGTPDYIAPEVFTK